MRKNRLLNRFSFKRVAAVMGLALLILAGQAWQASAQTVTQGYDYEGTLPQRGMLVALSDTDSSKVVLANTKNAIRTHGVAVNPNDAPVTISGDDQTVFVATVGRFEVLVSDQNGPIAIGDYIAASSISGIGMKADTKQDVIIGKALEVYDNSKPTVSTSQAPQDDGGSKEVRIGRINVDLGIGANPLAEPSDAGVPSFLRRAAEVIADKEEINPIRIYLGMLILLVASAIAGSLLFAGVKSALTAIGRNPLAKKFIVKGLAQVVLTSFLIFLIGIFGVYLLLKL